MILRMYKLQQGLHLHKYYICLFYCFYLFTILLTILKILKCSAIRIIYRFNPHFHPFCKCGLNSGSIQFNIFNLYIPVKISKN